MMRVTEIRENGAVAQLRIEGHITHSTVAELSAASEVHLMNGDRPLLLDVSGVRFVDAAGVGLLRNLEPKGAVLVGCSGFLSELLHGGTAPVPESATDDSETQLLDGLRRGDDAAFEQLVRQYGGRMLATARRMLGSDDDARDAVQDAFVSAFKSINSFTGAAKLSTWLHRIVTNAALMKMRSRRRKHEESLDDLLPCFDEAGEWVSGMATNGGASDLLEQRETRQIVRRCIDRLPETYRAVLLLRDIEELDTDEAAELLQITPNAVKIRLHRARQALRTLLEQERGALQVSPSHCAAQ